MNIERAAGAFSILLPLAFNAFFFLLGRRFEYPDILRRPTEEILGRFHAGGVGLKLLWYGFMLTAVLLAPLAVLLGQVLARDRPGGDNDWRPSGRRAVSRPCTLAVPRS